MRIRRLNLWLSHMWRPLAEVSLSLLAIGTLLLYRLDTLVPNFSPAEITTRISSSSLKNILHDPLFAPYKLLQYGLIRLDYANLFAMRLVSAVFGAIAIYIMYYVLKKWHSRRVSLMGTVLFATSAWFLHYARLATPSITYTLLLAALAYGTWIRHTRRPGWAVLVGAGLILSFVYTPGLIWFAIVGVIWQKQSVVRICSRAPRLTVIAVLALLVMLVPLGYAVYQNTLLLRSLAGLPQNMWPKLSLVKNNVISLGDLLFFRGNQDAMVGLIGLAVFDVFALAMLVLGVYDYVFMRKLDRIKMLGGTLLLGSILIFLGGPVTSILLAPFLYVIIAAGLGWLLEQWFTVFPRNPLARTVGLSLLLLAVGLSCWYQLNRYFVAWPHIKATKQVFNIKS